MMIKMFTDEEIKQLIKKAESGDSTDRLRAACAVLINEVDKLQIRVDKLEEKSKRND